VKISTSSDMYRHLDLAGACAEIRKAGCAGVDLWSSPRMCEHVGPQSRASEIRRTAADNGLSIAALTAYHTLSPKESLDRFVWAIEFASEVGAPCVVTNGVDWTGDMSSFANHIKPALKIAGRKNVRIAFENHSGKSFSATQAHLLMLSSEIPDSCFGFTIAPPHLAIGGSDVVGAIQQLGRRVFFFYAWDHVPGVDDDGKGFIWPPLYPEHHFPGKGRLDFASYIRALRDAGYEENSGGWINIRSYPGYTKNPWKTEQITSELTVAVTHMLKLISPGS